MADAQLPITGNSQSQTTTQSPQANIQSINSGSPTSSVQPGIASTQLNGQGSIALHTTALPTVSLNSAAPAATTTVPLAAVPSNHRVNPVLFSFVILLFLVAGVLVWTISHSAKSTT